MSLAETNFQQEVTRLKAHIAFITKEKEELSDLLENTRCDRDDVLNRLASFARESEERERGDP